MEFQTLAGLSHTLQTTVVAILIFAGCAYLPKLNYRSQLAKLPVLGGSTTGEKQRQTYLSSAKKMYDEGYTKVNRTYLSNQTLLKGS